MTATTETRTCITISAPIHHKAKIKAAQDGVTLKEFVDSALIAKIGPDSRKHKSKEICK